MEIDPRRLKHLLRIVEHGSFTRAAEALNVSQPALSSSIGYLEESLGVRLFDRSRHGATATDYGRVLEAYARTLETMLSRAGSEIDLKRQGYEGALMVGVTPIAAVTLVPVAIAEIVGQTPNVSITVTEDIDDHLIADLRLGKIDLIVGPVGINPSQADIEEEPIVDDAFVIVMRPAHPLANKASLRLQDLGDCHWVMPEMGAASHRQMHSLFGMARVPWPKRCITANSILAIKSILRHSDCVSIMSRHLAGAECDAGHLVSVELKGVHYSRTVGVSKRNDAPLSPLAERFVTALKSASQRI